MLNIRRFISRLPLRAREVSVIRGICRQIDWYAGQLEKMKEEKKKGLCGSDVNNQPQRPEKGK